MAKRVPKGQSRSLAGDNPELRVNIKETFGVDVSNKPALKQALGQAIIDKMVERSQIKSRSFDGTRFPKYEESYKKSLAFKAFGKTNKVNLTLTGDMLGLIDIVGESDNTLTFGWDDLDDANKAAGHINGIDSKRGKKVRDFFAINKREVEEIKRDFKDDIAKAEAGRQSFVQDAILQELRRSRGEGEG